MVNEHRSDSADREESLADLEEDTEHRMHSVADILPGGKAIHRRADRLSERAKQHYRRARALRQRSD